MRDLRNSSEATPTNTSGIIRGISHLASSSDDTDTVELLSALRKKIAKRHPVLVMSAIFHRHWASQGKPSDEEYCADLDYFMDGIASTQLSFGHLLQAIERGLRHPSSLSLASSNINSEISSMFQSRLNSCDTLLTVPDFQGEKQRESDQCPDPPQIGGLDVAKESQTYQGTSEFWGNVPDTCHSMPRPLEAEPVHQYSFTNVDGNPFISSSTSCLDGQITNHSKYVMVCGGYSDIWTGIFKGKHVAVKVLRAFKKDFTNKEGSIEKRLLKRIWREYLTWSSLSHPNIMNLFGFTYDFTHDAPYYIPALVSPWMEQGTIMAYLKVNKTADRIFLITGVIHGLHYLHDRKCPIIHGDLRGGNILISDDGVPRLTDFGLSRILNEASGFTRSSDLAGSLRWMAPELFEGHKVNKASDIWALGMTILEITTGERPYSDICIEPIVIRCISEGNIPRRPDDQDVPSMSNVLWSICEECWRKEAMTRPSTGRILADLI
ncbi:hypothetical protein M422DRAFT_243241 [Sphaerobolus stellatus SS14]|nr:hypothetical protein M422DRAFT_243241 [Sphaerobolus stellatus SS14]